MPKKLAIWRVLFDNNLPALTIKASNEEDVKARMEKTHKRKIKHIETIVFIGSG